MVLPKVSGSQIWYAQSRNVIPTADDQEPEDLFETISQTLLNSVDRDALSGWGAVVRIMYVKISGLNYTY
jgi:20S proteasome alpha/beta subunit